MCVILSASYRSIPFLTVSYDHSDDHGPNVSQVCGSSSDLQSTFLNFI